MNTFHVTFLAIAGGYPTTITIALVVIFLSFVMLSIVYLTIIISRLRSTYVSNKQIEASAYVSDKLNNYLYVMEQAVKITRDDIKSIKLELNKVKDLSVKNPWVTQVLIDQMIYLKRNFTDKTSNMLAKLYQQLDLKKSSFSKLKSYSWQVRAKGIVELREMAPLMKPADIMPYTHSRNDDLRVEAQAAYIKLNPSDPFTVLFDTAEILVEWHQMILFDVITRNEQIKIPSFSNWLNSPNCSIVIFCIKLVVHYTQLEAIPELIKLLDHPDKHVQNRAVNALGKLEVPAAERLLVERYPLFSKSSKIEVLKAMSRIGTGEQIPFLRSEFLHADDFYLRKYAMCAVISLTKDGKKEILTDMPQIDAQQKSIINHCFDKLATA